VTVHRLAARAFDAMAEEYERGRPGWPADAVAGLVERSDARTVLDLAAGTGKLTRVLAPLADVIAVEPLAGMRRVLEERVPGVRVLDGTAEAIPLPDASVDAVFVAEAFHWFDAPAALAEIARVLRPGGTLVFLWNHLADDHPPVLDELHEAVMRHRTTEGDGRTRESSPWREALEADERFEAIADEDAPHVQHTDRDAMVDSIASFSSIGGLPDEARAAALDDVRALLARHGVEEIEIPLLTKITTARRVDG
jgi:ubiquinone/menaquinone biosynthesis C-methylase UbiE